MRVLITGASGGIGEASATLFAKKGYDLVLVGRNKEKLEEIKNNLSIYNKEIVLIQKDLTIESEVKELVEECESLNIDILMNNAGFGDCGSFLESDINKQKDMIKVNVLALVELSYYFGNKMKEKGYGKIINTASVAGLTSGPYMSIYYATKAFVLSFSQALNEELEDISVTALCPGPVNTKFWDVANMGPSIMFKLFKPDNATHVAYKLYKGLLSNKTIIFSDISGPLLNVASRLLPRRLLNKIVGEVNGRR